MSGRAAPAMRASRNQDVATRLLSRDNYLYPALPIHRSGRLALDPRHTMYWEECGNPRGVPLVFLHGGPGGGISADHRRYYDPAFYRIVLYDQRGAGQSTPLGELADNTTQHLIADLERLRAHLGIDRWVVFGGSWGSTLALAYAETHPERVLALVLRGIFLARPWEIHWFMHDMRYVFPEAWQAFAGFLPEHEPAARCKGRHVRFERSVVDDDVQAVAVSFTTQSEPRRARLRYARGGHSL